MKITAMVMHRKRKHHFKKWKNKFVKDVEANFVLAADVENNMYTTSITWAQIAAISIQWHECIKDTGTAQYITTLEDNGTYTQTWLVKDGDSKVVVTIGGVVGFKDIYDIFICFDGNESDYNNHLSLMGIDPSYLNTTNRH